MEAIYRLLYQDIQLKPTGIVLGLLLVAAHLAAYLRQKPIKAWLPKFPRHRAVGIGLLLAATVWAYVLVSEMDLGEFYNLKRVAQLLLPIGFFLVAYFVPEFLAVRALGVLLMLAAGPVLQAAFLEEPLTRLLLPILAYVWIFVGMFWVGMPYLMRDWINWLVAEKTERNRWVIACGVGAGYGLLILLCAAAFWNV
jgi:hypothetical protein